MKLETNFSNLIERNRRFLRTNEDFKALSTGQRPEYVVIGCSDSRTTPTIVADSRLGEMFEIRLAGGIIDDASLASIEYAVLHLGTKKVLIMAHTGCGAVTEAQKMLVSGTKGSSVADDTALERLAHCIYDNIKGNPKNATDLTNAVLDNAKVQKEILEKSGIIRHAMESGLEIEIGLYNIETGELKIV